MSRLLGLTLVTVLAASTWLSAGASITSSAAAAARPGAVVTAFVEYGDPPVSVPPGDRARVSFVGRRGDIVRLSGALSDDTTLRTAGRRLRDTWSGYYRLGADRRYTFTFRPSANDPDSYDLLLEKLVVRPLARDRAVTFGSKRRGFLPAVSFDIQRGERTMITTPGYATTVLTAQGRQVVHGDPVLEAGRLLATARGDWDPAGAPLRPGRAIVLAGSRGTVRAVASEIVPVTLDGSLEAVPASRLSREVALRFPATSGQLVHLVGVPTTRVSPTMYGPTHATTRAPAGPVWRVLDSGMQTISVFPRPGTPFDAGAAVLTRIGSMTEGGAALTFSVPAPGQWVYADVVDSGYIPTLTATGSTFSPGVAWSASVTQVRGHNCLMPQGPLGCGDTAHATVTEATAQASAYMPLPSAPESVVFVQVPPGATGSVDLQVTRWQPPAPAPSARPSGPSR